VFSLEEKNILRPLKVEGNLYWKGKDSTKPRSLGGKRAKQPDPLP